MSLEQQLDSSSAAGELSCLPVPSRPVRAALHRWAHPWRYECRPCQGEPALTTSAQSGKARSHPVTGQGRHVAHQDRPPNRARTLNALPRNPSAGSCL